MVTARSVLAIAIVAMLPAAASLRAQMTPVQDHISRVADATEGTPGGVGLLPLAVAEGQVVALHAGLAAAAVNSPDDVRLHVGHVMHAIEPFSVLSGPGMGFGLRQAASEALMHLELAAAADSLSDNARMHLPHLISALGNVIQRADAVMSLARQIENVSSGSATAALVLRLDEQSRALVSGRDADGDDLIGWQAGEGGLRQVVQHMTLLKRGEGMLGIGP